MAHLAQLRWKMTTKRDILAATRYTRPSRLFCGQYPSIRDPCREALQRGPKHRQTSIAEGGNEVSRGAETGRHERTAMRHSRQLFAAWCDDYDHHCPHTSFDGPAPRDHFNRSEKDQTRNGLNS